MAISQIDKTAWKNYFDNVSRALAGKQAEVEVDALDFGQQFNAEWLPLLGIVYDPKSDVLEVVLEGLDHMIHHPNAVYVDHDASGLKSLEVVDADDVRQIVKLRDSLMLPAPPERH